MNKPLVYNYKTAEDKIEKLTARVEELERENDNLRIRCRIAEADRPKVAYLCDGRACGDECGLVDCIRTTQIEHAKNFGKEETGYYYEVEPSADVSKVAEIVEEILEIVKRLEG